MKQLVRLWKRPSYDGKTFSYYLLYYDEKGRRRQKALGHADARKAERQRAQLERELRMGIVEPGSMKLSEFLEDCLAKTQGQVRENTLREYGFAMNHFIKTIGNIDYLNVRHEHGEQFIRACLDAGNSPATANKKMRSLKRLFELACERGQLAENPLRRIRNPKVPRNKVCVFSDEECRRLLRAAKEMV